MTYPEPEGAADTLDRRLVSVASILVFVSVPSGRFNVGGDVMTDVIVCVR